MCVALRYYNKRDLKNSIGKKLSYRETSIHGPEYCSTGVVFGFGISKAEMVHLVTKSIEKRGTAIPANDLDSDPDTKHNWSRQHLSWHAKVTMADGLISAVE